LAISSWLLAFGNMRNFREYNVYQQSIQLCVDIYRICKNFPSDEKFALVNQLERAAVSISSNISEGSSRSSDVDFAHFLEISLGSAFEVETQLTLAFKLHYIDLKTFEELITQTETVQKGLGKFIGILRKQSI
jgi:four helix bundle protein